MSPAVAQLIAEAVNLLEPRPAELVGPIVGLIRDLLERDDPQTAVQWHAEKNAHSLAMERALRAEGTLK